MFPSIDTKDPLAVAALVRSTYERLYPTGDFSRIATLFADVTDMFAGKYLDYGAIDLKYHDFQHTLQATVCMAELALGRHEAGAQPACSEHQFLLGMTAVLLHDTGYLKLRSDIAGTGAKYTYTHVLRSCAVAATYLPTRGFTMDDLDVVLGAIRCTGPTSNIRRLHFKSDGDRLIGCCVATADYLGQMAADDYPEEIPLLFREFNESDDYLHVPAERRLFKSVDEMKAKTPAFWRKLVLPKLESEFESVYKFLAQPHHDGPNPYVEAIERNLARIQEQVEETV